MASSDYPETSATQLTVIVPVTRKRGRSSPETEVASALKPGSTITKIWLAAIPDSRDQKRSLRNCSLVAKWLEQHGSQLEELILTLDEKEEAELLVGLFKCPDLRLSKLLVSAADFLSDYLQRLPTTLQVFSGHLGAHGDLAPFAALPKLYSLGVRCYPSKVYDDRYTTMDIPMALLHHPMLLCLLVDVSHTVEFTSKQAMSGAPVSKLKLLAITGDLAVDDVHDLIKLCPNLQHLCLRCNPLPRMSEPAADSVSIDVRSLKQLKALELGFPQSHATFLGLTELPHLSAVLLCGRFRKQQPILPERLAKEPDEDCPELPIGEMIARRATLPGTAGKFPISIALALSHYRLVIEPRFFKHVSESMLA